MTRTFEAANSVDDLRYLVADAANKLRYAAGKVDALAAVTMETYDNTSWHSADQRQIDRVSHLLGMTAKAAWAIVVKAERLCALTAGQQPAEVEVRLKRSSRGPRTEGANR